MVFLAEKLNVLDIIITIAFVSYTCGIGFVNLLFGMLVSDIDVVNVEGQVVAADKVLDFRAYLKLFFRNSIDETAVKLNERYEELISILSNSRDLAILDTLNSLPVISPNAHTRPFHDYRLNMAVGIIFPIGLFFLIRIWIYRLRLYKDIQQIQKCSAGIIARIDKLNQASQ